MVGIVIISHSRTLAEGAAEVARTMGVGKAVVEPAGGDSEGGLGTSIDLAEDAVRRASGGDGVLLLADIGSSVLTARTLIEDAADAADAGDDLRLADAPLVEGAVAAASMAATGADLDAVHAAAESAREHRKT